MADKRKSFRAPRLASGRRLLPCLCLVAALALAGGAAHAQEAGLKSGAASLAAGKYQDAVRQLSAAINADNISPGSAAKALYLRGIAYRKMGESGRALADLGAAIWLGLPQSDRVKAQVNRGLAFKAAGLSRQGDVEIAAARKAAGNSQVDQIIADDGGAPKSTADIAAFSTDASRGGQASTSTSSWSSWIPGFGRNRSEPAAPAAEPSSPPTQTASNAPTPPATSSKPPAASGSWTTSVDGAEPQSSSTSGNRLTRWFRGSSSSEAPPPAPATQTAAASTPPSQPRSAPPAAAASSSWSTTTESQGAPEAESKRSWRIFGRSSEPEPAAQPAAAQATSGGYQVQLANSRSEAEAQALWKKASRTPGLQGVRPEIEKIDIGNFGTFYSLKVGPFSDKAQSVKVCNALKRSGIDCSLATL